MPELPEVHTISSDLNNNIKGYQIINIGIAENYSVYPNNAVFKSEAIGKYIDEIERVAKNIIIKLDSDTFIGIHLAMTGRILLRDEEHTNDRWTKIIFKLKKNSEIKYLRFTDMRMFGKAALYTQEEIQKLKSRYGPDVLDTALTPDKLYEILKSKRTSVKNILLDQEYISGLGNIYATDTLFLSKIHPETPTSLLTLQDAENILESAREIVNESIVDRGSTLPDRMYVDIFGNEGSHQEHFKIYLRNFCPKCGSKVEYIKVAGRGTYFCPECQKDTSKGLFE